MNLPGCNGCGEGVQAEAQVKQGRGEELSEDERAVLDADDPNEALPTVFGIPAYGPLSPYNGTYCKLCYWTGLILCFMITATAGYVHPDGLTADVYFGLPLWVVLFVFFVFQTMVVGYLGRYPILGAVFGPIVERTAASQDVYLTAKAKQDYADDESNSGTEYGDVDMEETEWRDMDIRNDIPEGVSVDIPVSDDVAGRDEVINRLQEHVERFREDVKYWKTKAKGRKEILEKRSAELQDRDDKLEKHRKSVKELKNEKKQKEELLDEKEQRVETLETKLSHLADFQLGTSNQRKNSRIPIWVPNAGNGGSKVGVYWLIQTVQVQYNRKDWQGSGWHALVVDNKADPLPGTPPDKISSEDIPKWEEHLLPRPDDVVNPAQFEHMDSPGYPRVDPTDQPLDEYPRVLFHESLGKTREALNDIEESVSGINNTVCLTLAYDTEGNYVPPPFDVRGYSPRSKWENLVRKRNRLIQSLNAHKSDLENAIEDLQHALQTTRQELEAESISAEQARKHATRTLDSLREKNRQLESNRRAVKVAQEEIEDHRQYAETAHEQAMREKEKRFKHQKLSDETIKNYESLNERDDKLRRIFEGITALWNRQNGDEPFDYDAIRNGDSEHSREDVIREFYENADDDEHRQLMKTIEQEMHNFAIADGGES